MPIRNLKPKKRASRTSTTRRHGQNIARRSASPIVTRTSPSLREPGASQHPNMQLAILGFFGEMSEYAGEHF
jgi:hypothetical protein